MSRILRSRIARILAPTLVLGAAAAVAAASDAAPPARPAYVPPIKHVFVINIENKGYDETWGPTSAAPYLSWAIALIVSSCPSHPIVATHPVGGARAASSRARCRCPPLC